VAVGGPTVSGSDPARGSAPRSCPRIHILEPAEIVRSSQASAQPEPLPSA
jgi:hypothetical protein